jgi:hypothetical protein
MKNFKVIKFNDIEQFHENFRGVNNVETCGPDIDGCILSLTCLLVFS